MRKSRFGKDQIVRILGEQEAGVMISDICQQYRISEQTFFHWKAKYGGMTPSEIKRLKALERDNLCLK